MGCATRTAAIAKAVMVGVDFARGASLLITAIDVPSARRKWRSRMSELDGSKGRGQAARNWYPTSCIAAIPSPTRLGMPLFAYGTD